MKKYQQLLIVSLGLVSFICFLIYKHEYDRLRNVLEVLEVFGSPPPQNAGLVHSHSHPLEANHNPALMAGSINELNLGQNHKYDNQMQEVGGDNTLISRNGHGVKPPDDVPPDGSKLNPNNVIQNPIQGSGEVIDNMIDDDKDRDIGKFGAMKAKKVVQRQDKDSIFKGRQKSSNDV